MQLRRFLFSHIGFCIVRASISYVYQWSINFKVHKTIHMSENIQNIVFEVLNSKMPKSLIFSGFLSIFTPERQKCIFLAFLTYMSTCLILEIKGPLFSTWNNCSQDAKSTIASKICISCIFSLSFFQCIFSIIFVF